MPVKPVGLRTLMVAVAVAAVFLHLIARYQRRDAQLREAVRRVQCLNNLGQIGQAIAAYESVFGLYPPGTIPDVAIPIDRRLGWAAPIHRAIGVDCCAGGLMVEGPRTWDDPQLIRDSLNHSESMHCPSCPKPRPTAPAAPASFVGIAGLGPDAPGLTVTDRRAGIFGDDRRVVAADIKDGLSQTMMVVESAEAPGPWFAGGRATVRGVDPARRPQVGPGRPFGGVHGEGANVLMADGSVRWVRPTPTSAGFEAMSTIAGAEVVSDPDDSP